MQIIAYPLTIAVLWDFSCELSIKNMFNFYFFNYVGGGYMLESKKGDDENE